MVSSYRFGASHKNENSFGAQTQALETSQSKRRVEFFLVQRPLDSGVQSSNASAKIFSEKEIKNATKGYNETRVLGAGDQGIIDEEEILSDSVEVASKSSRVENCKQVVQINLPNVVRL